MTKKARVVDLLREGVPRAEVARVAGCSWTWVAHVARELEAGVERRAWSGNAGGRQERGAIKARVVEFLKVGVPRREVARLAGCSRTWVRVVARDLEAGVERRRYSPRTLIRDLRALGYSVELIARWAGLARNDVARFVGEAP